ncbi:MAG: glycoside hydrolase family 9 protein [Pirellulales bacterium]
MSAVLCGGFVWMPVLCAQSADAQPTGAREVRLNTLGYLPAARKQASVAKPAERFVVLGATDGRPVLEGSLSGPIRNPDTNEDLYTADFSALEAPGEYRLRVEGVGESEPFTIAADLYVEPYRLASRAMYLMRCGTAVRGEHAGHEFHHAACHLEDGRMDHVVGNEVPTDQRQREATGGWHDAGDYNKYVVNSGVTVGCMLRAWHDFQPQLERIELDIPESAGQLPDLLAEVKWELDWLLKMQRDDGAVYHKVSAANYSGYMLPEDEREPRFFGEWGSQATASFVAMMAAASRELRPYDPEFADRCLAAAKKSYEFLRSHPEYQRPSQEGFHTVGYDNLDHTDWSARLWAAAEMWEATGDPAALADFETRARSLRPPTRSWRPQRGEEEEPPQDRLQGEFDANWDWSNPHNLGLLVYVESERDGRDGKLVDALRQGLIHSADQIVAARDAHGYARPLGRRYFWGCNGAIARQTVLLEAARRVDAKPEYRAATFDAVNYLLGRNPYGRSFMTGVGAQPPRFPHDRRSAADDLDVAWPGYLVGGPHPQATDWHDEQDDYRTNEIAINWNSALIYALAACLNDGPKSSAGDTVRGRD